MSENIFDTVENNSGENLQTIISDSKEKLKKPDPPKRKRGRPRKNPEKVVKTPEIKKTEPVLAPILSEVIKVVPFGILASSMKYDGFKLEDTEATQLGVLADQIIQTYLPDVENSKHAVLYLGVGTFAAILVSKFQLYYKSKKEVDENVQAN